uniref:inorganic diphosphatase n=1 Tax=viral metagenome TaxID=1070528 RepID=A0A6C0CL85_9ZZZZ
MTDVIIEIPKHSHIKYEYDHDTGMIRCDRILNNSMMYPANYGYIPKTLSGDGDPLDALFISDYQLHPGVIIKGRVVGVLKTVDECGKDDKLLMVPSCEVDKTYSNVNNYTDLGQSTLTKIKTFFENYKNIDSGKWVKVEGYGSNEEGLEILRQSYVNYSETNVQ